MFEFMNANYISLNYFSYYFSFIKFRINMASKLMRLYSSNAIESLHCIQFDLSNLLT